LPGIPGGAIHIEDEIAASVKVPRLDHRAVAGFFELPGDPFRPALVGAGVADEEIAFGARGAIGRCLRRIRRKAWGYGRV